MNPDQLYALISAHCEHIWYNYSHKTNILLHFSLSQSHFSYMFTISSFVVEKLRFRRASVDENKKSLSTCERIKMLMKVISSIDNKEQSGPPSDHRRNEGNGSNWGYNDSVLVTGLLLAVLASLDWNPKRLIHLFSLQPPLTCPTCVSPAVCTSRKHGGICVS